MGRLLNLAIFVSAIGGAYVAFAGPIGKAAAVLQTDLTKIGNGITPPPTSLAALITATPASGPAPLTVNFASTITGGFTPYTYAWEFGDSSTGTSQNPSHIYTGISGQVTAQLTVTDAKGNVVVAVVNIFVGVQSGGLNQGSTTGTSSDNQTVTPFNIASFEVSPSPIQSGTDATWSVQINGGSGQFKGSISYADGTIDNLTFDVNGSVATASDLHEYAAQANPGALIATLTVIDTQTNQSASSVLTTSVLASEVVGSGGAPAAASQDNIVINPPTIENGAGNSFIITVTLTNNADTENEFVIIANVVDKNGSTLANATLPVSMNANSSQTVSFSTSQVGAGYSGQSVSILLACWTNSGQTSPVANPISVPATFPSALQSQLLQLLYLT